MPKTPFGGGNGGLQPTVSLMGQIGQSSKTTPDTRGIGTLSLDFSGQQKQNENNLKAEGLGAIPGLIGDVVTGGIGGLVGGAINIAAAPGRALFGGIGDSGGLREGAVKRYMGEDPGFLSNALTELSYIADPYQSMTALKAEQRREAELGVPYTLAKPFLQVGAKIATGVAGVAITRDARAGVIGGATFLPKMMSNDPDTLPAEVKSILDNGGTAEDALTYMRDNYRFTDNEAADLLTGFVLDPVRWLGYPISFSSKIGASQQLSDIASNGKSWQEFLLSTNMNKVELSVAKRMGFLGKTYNSTVGPGWEAVKSVARASVVDATMKVIDARIINEADEVAREIGGSAQKLLANNLNRTLNFMIVDASKSPLTRNAASGAREWAESVIANAAGGRESLSQMPEFLGASDEILDDIIRKVKDYQSNYSDDAKDALNGLLDSLRKGRNIKLINDEVGGFFMKGAKRIPYVGKYFRQETIYAARKALYRSLQRHENDVVRAFDSGDVNDLAKIRSQYVSKMSSALDSAANGGTEVLERYFNRKFAESQAKWALGKKEDAILEMSRVMEIAQMNGLAQAIRVVQPLRKLTGQKITPVLSNRFSRETLESSIETLQKAIDSGDKEVIAKVVNDLVIQYQDLSFKFDSLNFGKNLGDDPSNIGQDILQHMKRLYKEEAYVTRLPDEIIGKMDEFEFGIAPSARMGGEGAASSMFLKIFSNSKFGAGKVEKISDINHVLTGEVTKDVLTEAVERGEDISSWSNISRMQYAEDGKASMPSAEFANSILSNAIDTLTSASKTGTIIPAATPKSNMWLQRNLSENLHTGVRMLQGLNTEAKNYFSAPTLQSRSLTDMLDAVTSKIDVGPAPKWAEDAKIKDLIPDESYAGRLYDAPGSVMGYDGIYLFNDSYGPSIVQKAAATNNRPMEVLFELIWNRMSLSMFEDPAYSGVWRAANIMLEKRNPSKMINNVFGQKFTEDSGMSFIDNTFVGLNSTFTVGVDKTSKILGKTDAGVAQLKSLSAKDKERVFLDPRRILLGYLTENVPMRSVPDLDRTIFRFSTTADQPNTVDSVQEMIGELRLPNGGQWNPNLDIKEWIKMYLGKVVDEKETRVVDVLAEGNQSDFIVMLKYSQEELDMFAKTGIDNPKPQIDQDATAAKILNETDGIGSYLYLAARHMDQTRNVSLDPGTIASSDIRSWEKMAPINEDGAQKFSFSDLFHFMDNLNDPLNRNMAMQSSKESLGKKFEEMLYDSYYEFGAQGIRPFDFISYNNIPHSAGALLRGQAKNEFNNTLAQQVLDGKITPVEALQTAAREAMIMESEDFADLSVVATFGTESGTLHRMVDRLGIFVDNRLSKIYGKTARSMRVYDPSGSPMLETRYVQSGGDGKSVLTGIPVVDDTSATFMERFAYPQGLDVQSLRLTQNDVAFDAASVATKAAVQAEEITVDTSQPMTPEQAAAELADPGAAARRTAEEASSKEAVNKSALEELTKARATLREIGYEMGLEPKQPYIQSLDIMRDVAGNAVIRPRFDIYTSIDEVEDLAAFGMKDENVLPMRGKGPFNKVKQWTIPISNNEIYDSGVERLRYYLGNRISQEDSLRAMANIAEYSMKMEINPGGLGNEKLAEILIDVLGGGEKGLRAYNRAFGVGGANASPRAALMYALQGRPETIGWTTNISKRLQAKNETMAMIAQKLYPLTRYRYNPYFNWQEGIEPYAFNILRGVRGEKDYEDGSMMARLLSMKGGAMLDYSNVGAHVLLRNASVLQRITQQNPAIDVAVGTRAIDRLLKAGEEGIGVVSGGGEKFRQSISDAKEVSVSASTLNEAIREAAPSIIRDQPEVGLNWLEITGSIDPATNFRYFMDQSINGMMPTQIIRVADVASARHTFGAPIEESWLKPFEDVAGLENVTKAQIEDLEDISAALEKVGGPIELRKKLAYSVRKYLASVKSTISGGAKTVNAGRYFKGQPAITTTDGLDGAMRGEIRGYTGNDYRSFSKYLGAKAQYGVQLNNPTQDLAKMTKVAGSGGDFSDIERSIGLLDAAILNNRIINRGRIYRGFDFKVIVNDSDIPNLKPGFRFGDESFLSWSKAEGEARTSPGIEQAGPGAHKTVIIIDDAKGMPGLDLNAVGSNVPSEEEVLLPRGMEFEIVEVLPKQPGRSDINYYKVKPLLPPQAVEIMSKMAPNDAARLELSSAISDIKIQQAKNVETYNDLARLFTSYPDLLEGVREMGMKLGLEPAAQSSVRYRARKKPSVSPSKVDNFDPMATHDRYSTQFGEYKQPEQRAYLDPTTVFGRMEAGPQATLNTGGKTGIWTGNDGVRRYIKTIKRFDPSSSSDDFNDPHSIVNEFIVNRLLKKMGVAVPEVSLVNDGDNVYLASQWVEGMMDLERVPITYDIAKAVADNHVADLIVANFDALGPDLKNMGIMPDGTIVRTDVGNSTFYRAGGGLKYNKKIGAVDPRLWEDVDPSFWWNPEIQNSLGSNRKYKEMLEKAYPELKTKGSTLEIPNFIEQYTDMATRLGKVSDAVDEIVNSIRPFIDQLPDQSWYRDPNRNLQPITGAGVLPTFDARIAFTKNLLEKRINQIDSAVGRIRDQRLAEWNAQVAITKPGARPKIRKQDKWIVDFSERMAAAQAEGIRLPGLDAAIATVKAGGKLLPEQINAISNGLAPFIYKRGAMKQFIDSISQMHAVAAKRSFKEQMYSTYKGSAERTFNHPFMGPYPTSYMYGKVLPAFFDALFKYAPFTSEFAPFAGVYRLDKFADYIATELETNDELYDYVMRRPPLLMFLSGLLPGWPTDIGASLPYWFRDGVMRPVAEGKFEDIPGRTAEAIATTVGRQFGIAQTIDRAIDSVSEIQSFLTGDPSTSVIDDISEFLSIKDSN
jgi:hypothetical protein